ncbi:MAG: 50S ribosomal protein L9 [Oscillospiraceae bacterium]|jgi:large subunit ribosomal protein L9|nr:50S ribosomal protein L9 [Oscillospiraceae bacterium]
MKVILQADVKGHGKKGDLVEASDGYARNYLLPRKLAIEATAENLNTLKLQDEARRQKAEREKAAAVETREKLNGKTVELAAKCGSAGRLFGAVTAAEVAEAVTCATGVAVDKRKLSLDEPIKALGSYPVKLKLGYDVTAAITLRVVEAGE